MQFWAEANKRDSYITHNVSNVTVESGGRSLDAMNCKSCLMMHKKFSHYLATFLAQQLPF